MGHRKGPLIKSPESNVPTSKGAVMKQVQDAAEWEVNLVQEGHLCVCKKGVWELRTEESCSPLDHRCPTEVDTYYVVYSNEDAGGGAGETVGGAQEDVGAAGLEQ